VEEAAPSPWRRLGRVLVEDGLLTEDQLDAALENQVRTRRLLGDILVELGYVSSGNVERALAIQAGLPVGDGVTFGSGLRSELERRAAEPVAPVAPVAPVLHLVETQSDAPAPAERDPGHVLMVQRPGGYALVDREGSPPVPGTLIELPEEGAFRVEAVGRSPYPDDPRRCAFALPVHDFAV
jgi:hypothetical protein